jgi:hypothetical protein
MLGKGNQKSFLMLIHGISIIKIKHAPHIAAVSANLASHGQNCVMVPAELDFIFVYQF